MSRDTEAVALMLEMICTLSIRMTKNVEAAFDPVLYSYVSYYSMSTSNYSRRVEDFGNR